MKSPTPSVACLASISAVIQSGFLVMGIVAFSAAHVSAQATAPATGAPATGEYKSDLGFTYGYTTDWELIDSKPITPLAQEKAAETAKTDEEKKGAACAQIGLMLKRGDPASIIMTVSLPYDCYGSQFTDAELPAFGEGVSSGLKQNFTVAGAKTASYKSGTHSLWVERAQATAKADPTKSYMIETVCSILKKGATCWIGMAKDDAALLAMEQGKMTLDGEAPTALVPASAQAELK